MNYMKIYNDLVDYAKSQILSEGTYVERHHIIMKSLGGSNDKSNLVTFTARQHYIAHLLLYKHYKQEMLLGKDKTPYYKSLGALSALIQLPASLDENEVPKRCFKFGSRTFEIWKKELSIYNGQRTSKRLKNLKENELEQYEQYCQKISESLKKRNKEFGFWWSGKKHSEETIQKIKEHHQKYHPQAGSKNSQYGMIAIYNEETFERSTQPKDQPIPDGWVKGRFYNATPEQLIERKHLVEEILLLDSNSKANIRMTNDKLKQILENLKNPKPIKPNIKNNDLNRELKRQANQKILEEKIKFLTEQYSFYRDHGWDKFVEKYNYKYSYPNFVQQCKKYVKDFIPQNGKKRGL